MHLGLVVAVMADGNRIGHNWFGLTQWSQIQTIGQVQIVASSELADHLYDAVAVAMSRLFIRLPEYVGERTVFYSSADKLIDGIDHGCLANQLFEVLLIWGTLAKVFVDPNLDPPLLTHTDHPVAYYCWTLQLHDGLEAGQCLSQDVQPLLETEVLELSQSRNDPLGTHPIPSLLLSPTCSFHLIDFHKIGLLSAAKLIAMKFLLLGEGGVPGN